jgi:alkyl sulfatase BDS1-like metallo-beta-lactamase superfamily hydrolase
VVQAMHHLVFAQPDYLPGRELLADAMEQLGYQAESSTWRNAYLLGALEARRDPAVARPPRPMVGAMGMLSFLPTHQYLQHLAVRVNGPKAQDLQVRIDWVMRDEGKTYRLTLRNGALTSIAGSHGEQADAVLSLDRATLIAVVEARSDFMAAIDAGRLEASGNREALRQLFGCMDTFDFNFNIVEP